MGRVKGKSIMKDVTGKVGRQVVFRKLRGETLYQRGQLKENGFQKTKSLP